MQTSATNFYNKLLFLLGVFCCFTAFFIHRDIVDYIARYQIEAKAEPAEAEESSSRGSRNIADSQIETKAEPAEAEESFLKSKKIKKKKRNVMDCEGFPDWPLSPAVALYDDNVGASKCDAPDVNNDSNHPLILHQTSAPNRRPSVSEVNATLSNLPFGTGYTWHSDKDICAFMRTQPLRFQALYNAMGRTPHKVDLWRYLLLYKQGGIYLDDDAELLVRFNSSFVDSVDSVYVTQGNKPKHMGVDKSVKNNVEKQRAFGFTIYNGLLISKPCNRVLLSVAERMVQIGPIEDSWARSVAHPDLMNWYNLKLLAMAIAERSPNELHTDVNCEAGPINCSFFERDPTNHKLPFNNKRSIIVYDDDQNWKTAVFDVPQCGMAVQQAADGKHNVVSVDPHPSPWFPIGFEPSGGPAASSSAAERPTRNNVAGDDDNFYTSTWPPLQKIICGEGAPNLHLASELFRLARDEVFSTNDNQGRSYAPTQPLEALNTTELQRSIKEGKLTATADQFFRGNWAISVLDGNHTHQDGKLTRFRTRYVRIWKAGNNQIRLLEEDLAKHLGTADYRSEVHMEKKWFSKTTKQEIEPCIYTVIRDPIDHFLSGYNEIEYRELREHTWPSAPYHAAVPYNKNDTEVLRNRFRAFVENLLVEDGSFLVNSVYSHPFSMSRVLASLAMIGRKLDGYLLDVANLTERWPEFFSTTCPGVPPVDAFPKAVLQGQHKSSGDPWGTYKASKEVWTEGGPVARAMCLLSAPDYACFDRLPAGIPEFCQTVYRDHARTLTEYGQDHYMKYPALRL
mmetsp:Transcript_24775/g.58151  ORF Transcript_24775/g.58151 Transcript_24775/m.58151 type:complete len:793 (+) Transcript_24775:112-2490(+)|eukprot:CAMPEP_0197173674 /NCGR_PEP_ID=MMETSP1423-20130617/511_1 /TAXON_ID=476441 /ORGANISM="Pseudo-nitzschia heimii, Strain UNC1101" /LENGTH=792 /DNA_ID=CAMNT_0042622519 /DNA_START=100 /DNA_END=2478 /DNA_ORIENTATION=-